MFSIGICGNAFERRDGEKQYRQWQSSKECAEIWVSYVQIFEGGRSDIESIYQGATNLEFHKVKLMFFSQLEIFKFYS